MTDTEFAKMINSLNGKSLQCVLCAYTGISPDSDPDDVDKDFIEDIGLNYHYTAYDIMGEVIAANWKKCCKVEIIDDDYTAFEGCATVKVTFNGFSIKDFSFELSWIYE